MQQCHYYFVAISTLQYRMERNFKNGHFVTLWKVPSLQMFRTIAFFQMLIQLQLYDLLTGY